MRHIVSVIDALAQKNVQYNWDNNPNPIIAQSEPPYVHDAETWKSNTITLESHPGSWDPLTAPRYVSPNIKTLRVGTGYPPPAIGVGHISSAAGTLQN